MANYLYRLADIEANVDLYTEGGAVPVGPPYAVCCGI
jgi:hypothetical protein